MYEEKGIDYPAGYVRWTAQRNMQAVLGLMSEGKLPVEKLTSHRFPIDRASEAYDLITGRREPFLGIVLDYGEPGPSHRTIRLKPKTGQVQAPTPHSMGVSMIGAGNFARLVMLPILSKIDGIAWRGICTAKGVTAESTGQRNGFEFATTDTTRSSRTRELRLSSSLPGTICTRIWRSPHCGRANTFLWRSPCASMRMNWSGFRPVWKS